MKTGKEIIDNYNAQDQGLDDEPPFVTLEEMIDEALEEAKAIPIEPPVKPACEQKLIISIENDTVLFDNLNDFKPLEFMGILHNAVSTADVLYKTKVIQMVEKASKSV